MKVIFQLRFHTHFGQSLFVSGNHPVLGNDAFSSAVPMHYFNSDYWVAEIAINSQQLPLENISYHYILKNADGSIYADWAGSRTLQFTGNETDTVVIVDAWNHAGFFGNTFYTEPFQQVLLKENFTEVPAAAVKAVAFSHTFRVKSPLLQKGEVLCITGSAPGLGEWNTETPTLLHRQPGQDDWTVSLDLNKEDFPIAYKYGVYNTIIHRFVHYEEGVNRVLFDTPAKNRKIEINDGFTALPDNTWKGAGVSIPVFSLKSDSSMGIGSFSDIHLLVDWAVQTGLKLIQLLPVNDTTANYTISDSYPYAAISAFALHPIYIDAGQVALPANQFVVSNAAKEAARLNKLEAIDYPEVIKLKRSLLKQLYALQGKDTFADADFNEFFEENSHWLVPYAVFCHFRDKYNTADYSQWAEHAVYNEAAIAKLASDTQGRAFESIGLHYFIQYHLHLQLKKATQYAHDNGVIIKGDIPIGIYRYSVDAWQQPSLYNMNVQAGAPPDDFAIKGQNWGFPTYNWQLMQLDGFAWWKQRLHQMSYYFDAFRIDHILGFFRIWTIPIHAVEGIMGYFEPAIPVHVSEFYNNNIWFDHHRYTQPYINDQVLQDIFGDNKENIKKEFLNNNGPYEYTLRAEFATQRQVEAHFAALDDSDYNNATRQGLYDLLSNVILFEVKGSEGQQYHFRFGMDQTLNFRYLDPHTQYQLHQLYVNYFYQRQDDFWRQEALKKLPALKRVTNMLICGEDLGMVPACVPDVMKQLGFLSLEIQRMPKNPATEFFHPAYAPYLSVVTPSTHDMSTIRGWWEEDRNKTQHFFNNELNQWGDAPYFCEAWVNKAIVMQHLYSPAMWSIFQLQDLLGMDAHLRRDNPHDERINIPANPKHYWRYRMHLSLEQLMEATSFNTELKEAVKAANR
ncbi:4-alpha-glucanotransferase [Filimonas lacunae]|uniref:4-alpha-glucanotransferase n=1 Tax=Filimonas lacunae TaxID=477680 RepID=A0A173MK70_9BACT|nr:4-alpha-glucanotransferase [Filimonas lacunae]BAV08045.1 4-alpha-glucanotransferase [Filimonas lacunae]SIT08523.1 4-alpha-glucanotransferase [Filimonas lacunae]